jgi:uncharacterized membrane protein (DUF4010 family)
MQALEPFLSLAVALAAGLLLGMEREQSRPLQEQEQQGFVGGSRTFPLVSLIGASAMLFSRQLGPWLVVAGFLTLAGFLVVSYAADVRAGRGKGITSEAAFLLSYLLGALALTEGVFASLERKLLVVGAIAVVSTTLLTIKPALHGLMRRASQEDVYATVKFLIVAVVLLPLLPDRPMGPLGALNPRGVGLLVVLIAAISFVGYLSVRVLGPHRGLGLTGLVGGLASSTAVTLTFAGKAKETPELRTQCALAVALASTIMFPRALLEVAVVNRALLPQVALPLGLMGVAGLAVSGLFYLRSRRKAKASGEVQFQNPFRLAQALKFALLFAAVLLASKAALHFLGNRATYAVGVLAGITDVDAITLSMAELARGPLEPRVAATTIFLGAASNTVAKAVMASVVGGWHFGRQLALAFGAMLGAGALGLAWLWLA